MFLQNLLCCGTCSGGFGQYPVSSGPSEFTSAPNKIFSQAQLYSVSIKMGEIMKLRKGDKVPHLEVIVEMENERIQPTCQFVYLHNIENELDEVKADRVFEVESIEWAENIGKAYIKLDFDRTKKYKMFYIKKTIENKSPLANPHKQPEKRLPTFRYEILGQSPAFSIQASVSKRQHSTDSATSNQKQRNNSNHSNNSTLDENTDFNQPRSIKNQNILVKNRSSALNTQNCSRLDDPYGGIDAEARASHQISPSKSPGRTILQNYNPMTRTYFKCSIYSPSNRLYTVDEVNSTFSGEQHQSQNTTFLNQNHLISHKKQQHSQGPLDYAALRARQTLSPSSFDTTSKVSAQLSACPSDVFVLDSSASQSTLTQFPITSKSSLGGESGSIQTNDTKASSKKGSKKVVKNNKENLKGRISVPYDIKLAQHWSLKSPSTLSTHSSTSSKKATAKKKTNTRIGSMYATTQAFKVQIGEIRKSNPNENQQYNTSARTAKTISTITGRKSQPLKNNFI